MLFCEICKLLGRYLLLFTLVLLIPTAIAFYYQLFVPASSHPQPHSGGAFLGTALLSFLLALVSSWMGRKASSRIHRTDAIFAVVLIWCITTLLSALPFYLSRTLTSPIDACFEAMSGLTTTGASVMAPKAYDPTTGAEIAITFSPPTQKDVNYSYFGTITPIVDPATGAKLEGLDAISRALLFWRSFLQWLGGVGIVVLFITVLPALAMGGRFLYEAETPGPEKEGLAPRIKTTAILLLKIYVGLSLFAVLLLFWIYPEGHFFDLTCLALSTIATGGFVATNAGLASYDSHSLELALELFMLLGSISFVMHAHLLRLRLLRLKDSELLTYLSVIFCAIALTTSNLWHRPISLLDPSQGVFHFGEALRVGAFQALSAITSTGLSNSNYEVWPFPAQMLLILLTFIGGMSGSTCGGIKISRHMMAVRATLHKVESIFRPETVRTFKMGQREIPQSTVMTVLIFICLAIASTLLGTYLLMLEGIDPKTSFGLIASFINNAGLSFGGPDPSYPPNFLSSFGKMVAVLWMMLGRLEFFAILVLFVPAFWKK